MFCKLCSYGGSFSASEGIRPAAALRSGVIHAVLEGDSQEKKQEADMEMNSRESKDHHVVKIWEVNKDRLYSLQQKISEQPKLLRSSAGGSSCCVFRVPRCFIDNNGRAYQPDIVSIGPYHHRKSLDSHLQMLEEHKWRYLGSLVSRTEMVKGVGLEDYLKALQPLESKARDCYSETIGLTVDEFVEMMVLDGCFVIEFFRKMGSIVSVEEDDPIFFMSWVWVLLTRDLFKLENQIPLFVLQSLFDLSKIPGDRIPGEEREASLASLALNLFKDKFRMPEKVCERYNDELAIPMPEHLLGLLHSCYIPEKPPQNIYSNSGTRMIDCATTKLLRALIRCKSNSKKNSKSQTRMIQCVTKLRRAGIRCKSAKTGDSFLDIKFGGSGVIEMPAITINDSTSSFLLNCVAYEQCHWTSSKHKYFTTYTTFMDFLINTPQDVGLLCDDKVINNNLGGDEEVAQFFNKCGKDVAIDINKGYLSKVFDDIDEYYRTNWNVYWATFLHTYFDSPWSVISAGAAVVLLLLTVAQTFFTAYDHFK